MKIQFYDAEGQPVESQKVAEPFHPQHTVPTPETEARLQRVIGILETEVCTLRIQVRALQKLLDKKYEESK